MDQIRKRIEELNSELIHLRRDFHRYPELGFKEYRTAEAIETYLHKLGIDTRRMSQTGVVALLEGAANPFSLEDYLKAFDITLSVMQSEAALERTAYELAERIIHELLPPHNCNLYLFHFTDGANNVRFATVDEAQLRTLRQMEARAGSDARGGVEAGQDLGVGHGTE